MKQMVVERILYNGNIYTQDAAQPRVQALALVGETIVAAGTDQAVLALASSHTHKQDCRGRRSFPA
ncbi:hypothetical protein HC776_03265 [bacterium]|nr:hypothetical protein [bacterium]